MGVMADPKVAQEWRPANYSVSEEDTAIIFASISVYCACIAQGCCISVVNTSAAAMALIVGVDVVETGWVLFAGGIGFFLGCVFFTLILDAGVVDGVPKHYLCCVCSIWAGLSTVLLAQTSSLGVCALYVMVQMAGLGGVLLFATLR
jgi:hypothetical protein